MFTNRLKKERRYDKMYLEIMQKRKNINIYKLSENKQFLYNVYHKSDRGYKYLFGIKRCFLEFLRNFVKEA